MKYENPEMEFMRLAMYQDVITGSIDINENDGLINGGGLGEGDSSDSSDVLP